MDMEAAARSPSTLAMASPSPRASPSVSALASPFLQSPAPTTQRVVLPIPPSLSPPSYMVKLPGLQFSLAARRTSGMMMEPSAYVDDSGSSNCESPIGAPTVPYVLPTPTEIPSAPLQLTGMDQRSDATNVDPDEHDDEPDHENENDMDMMDEEQAKLKKKKGTRRGTLNAEAKRVLKAWMFSPAHFAHPYPSEEEKEQLAQEAGIDVKQLSNWFTNARKRLWQPVLRQSGVEVKNFLSTGRGGPRGNKLDIPPDLERMILNRSPLTTPPISPSVSTDSMASTTSGVMKRKWAEIQSATTLSTQQGHTEITMPKKKAKKTIQAARKRAKECRKKVGNALVAPAPTHLTHELHYALAAQQEAAILRPSLANLRVQEELEMLAATSLLGLHRQFQPVY